MDWLTLVDTGVYRYYYVQSKSFCSKATDNQLKPALDLIALIYVRLCKLENEILKTAKNAQKWHFLVKKCDFSAFLTIF